MKAKRHLFYGLLLTLTLIFSLSSFASASSDKDEHAVKTIAKILSHVNHFPSAAEKKTLQKIADDSQSSAHVRTIANTMIHMQHSVSSGDKAKLKKIANDGQADDDVRQIASILINFSHQPSRSDKKKLHDIMD